MILLYIALFIHCMCLIQAQENNNNVSSLSLITLPPDIIASIGAHTIANTASNLYIPSQPHGIHALQLSNKFLNNFFNDASNTVKLIHRVTDKFSCDPIKAAFIVHTPAARKFAIKVLEDSGEYEIFQTLLSLSNSAKKECSSLYFEINYNLFSSEKSSVKQNWISTPWGIFFIHDPYRKLTCEMKKKVFSHWFIPEKFNTRTPRETPIRAKTWRLLCSHHVSLEEAPLISIHQALISLHELPEWATSLALTAKNTGLILRHNEGRLFKYLHKSITLNVMELKRNAIGPKISLAKSWKYLGAQFDKKSYASIVLSESFDFNNLQSRYQEFVFDLQKTCADQKSTNTHHLSLLQKPYDFNKAHLLKISASEFNIYNAVDNETFLILPGTGRIKGSLWIRIAKARFQEINERLGFEIDENQVS